MSSSKMKYVILCFLMTRIQTVYGLRCMACSELPTPVDCNRITTCGHSEQCYVDQYVTRDGMTLYSSGCRSQFRCAAQTGKKRFLLSSTDILTCSQCCHNVEFCNIEGCGIKAPQMPRRGLFCFQCDAQSSPDTCRDIVTCDAGNACVVSQVLTGPQIYYQSSCIEENACVSIETDTAAIFGRRRQTIEQCPVCCRTDFCNDNCNRTVTTIPISSLAGSSSHVSNVLSSPTAGTTSSLLASSVSGVNLAVSAVPSKTIHSSTTSLSAMPTTFSSPASSSFGTTTSLCQDKPTLDCKTLDTFWGICYDRKTAKPCLKTCGFCP